MEKYTDEPNAELADVEIGGVAERGKRTDTLLWSIKGGASSNDGIDTSNVIRRLQLSATPLPKLRAYQYAEFPLASVNFMFALNAEPDRSKRELKYNLSICNGL